MRKRKKTFADSVKSLKAESPLKEVRDDTPLPYVFDLHWDAKQGRDLDQYRGHPEVMRHLAENGFDVARWLKKFEWKEWSGEELNVSSGD
jgi:hypothetical protein